MVEIINKYGSLSKRVYFILTIILTSAYIADAQVLLFKNNPVDSVKISSNVYVYSSQEHKGYSYTSRYVVSFRDNRNGYLIDRHEIEKIIKNYKPIKDNDSIKMYKKVKRKLLCTKVNNTKLRGLLQALRVSTSLSQDNELLKNLFIDYVTPEKIREIAKKHDAIYHFRRKYAEPEEIAEIYRGCMQLDTFGLYLTELDTNLEYNYVFTFDFEAGFQIMIYTKEQRYFYTSTYPHTYGLPWFDIVDGNTMKIVGQEYVLNPEINYYLHQFLPRNFLLKNQLSFEKIMSKYIEWYLYKRDLIFLPKPF